MTARPSAGDPASGNLPDSRWPLHAPPYPGESLSSWVHRLAHALDVSPAVLVRSNADPVGQTSTGYTLDFDPPDSVLFTLAEGTGQPISAIRKLTARGYVPSLLDAPEGTLIATKRGLAHYTHGLALFLPIDWYPERHEGFDRRVLPWYSLQRFRQTHGCPECLEETPEPYLRLRWRFPWMITCPVHQCLLTPFIINRPVGRSPEIDWPFKQMHMSAPSRLLFTLDAITLQAITDGHCDLPLATIPAGLWLRLLRTVLDELGVGVHMAGACSDRLKELWASVDRTYGRCLGGWRPYERLYPRHQQMFMTMAAQVLTEAFAAPDGRWRIVAMIQMHRAGPHSRTQDTAHRPLSVSHS